MVLKRSGDRVPFEQAKITEGIAAAAKGRPIEEDVIEQAAASIAEELRLLGPELTSEQVGFAVLEHLREIDHVAYMRFASVYRQFKDTNEFLSELSQLLGSSRPAARAKREPERPVDEPATEADLDSESRARKESP